MDDTVEFQPDDTIEFPIEFKYTSTNDIDLVFEELQNLSLEQLEERYRYLEGLGEFDNR